LILLPQGRVVLTWVCSYPPLQRRRAQAGRGLRTSHGQARHRDGGHCYCMFPAGPPLLSRSPCNPASASPRIMMTQPWADLSLLQGEHGVGLVKRDYLPHELGEATVDTMRKVSLLSSHVPFHWGDTFRNADTAGTDQSRLGPSLPPQLRQGYSRAEAQAWGGCRVVMERGIEKGKGLVGEWSFTCTIGVSNISQGHIIPHACVSSPNVL
jgi:hypothetical protein